MSAHPLRWLFLYWGRRGFSRFAYEIVCAAMQRDDAITTVSVSRDNEEYARFEKLGAAVRPVTLFNAHLGAVTRSPRIVALRRELRDWIERDSIDAVITLMPHVWSPFVTGVVRDMQRRYATIVHDVIAHPGDRTGLVNYVHLRDVRNATDVIALSAHVARRFQASAMAPNARLHVLFHPEMPAGDEPRPRRPAGPLRLLSIGRMQAYKGLDLLASTLEELRRQGFDGELSVMGEGELGPVRRRLEVLGARIENRWLANEEIAAALACHDAVLLTHTEASQSGIIPLAHGVGLPVISTNVGGLREQIREGETGLLSNPEARDLAATIARLGREAGLYQQMAEAISKSSEQRSAAKFVGELRRIFGEP